MQVRYHQALPLSLANHRHTLTMVTTVTQRSSGVFSRPDPATLLSCYKLFQSSSVCIVLDQEPLSFSDRKWPITTSRGNHFQESSLTLSLIQYRNEPEPVSLLNSARSRDRRLNWHHNAARFGCVQASEQPRSPLDLLVVEISIVGPVEFVGERYASGGKAVGTRQRCQRCPRACPHVPQGVCRSEGLVHKSTGRDRHFETGTQAAVSACLRDRNSSSRAWFNASAAWTSLTARAALSSCSKVTPGSRYCSTSSSDLNLSYGVIVSASR